MNNAELLDKFKNGREVREKRYNFEDHPDRRVGVIHGTSMGGATKRGKTIPTLMVNVKWNDGTESQAIHHAFEVEGFDY